MFDLDGSGSLTANEVRSLLASIGSAESPEDVAKMVARVDRNGSGRIQFGEFVRGLACLGRKAEVLALASEVL